MPLPYFTTTIDNQPLYKCLMCQYDCFSQDSIAAHCSHSHPKVVLPEMELSQTEWIAKIISAGVSKTPSIAICLLTWNTKEASTHSAQSIVAEMARLELLGVKAKVYWADNKSTDGTQEAVQEVFGEGPRVASWLFRDHVGQCAARNAMIDMARSEHYDYIMMLDGDVEIIPFSSFAMMRYLWRYWPVYKVGCIGMYSLNCTHQWDNAVAEECRCIKEFMVSEDTPIAWTNYGMFVGEMFDPGGIRFDTAEPFQGIGWGLEDDDLYLQMVLRGWKSVNTKYFRHMHRRRHSSIKLIGEILASNIFEKRREYIVQKWKNEPTAQAVLMSVARHRLPRLEY